jgi:ubiquinone biosynthesis accessory factor UbiJ
MLHTLNALLAPALMERLALVVNHVLAGEPAATERLRPHAGRLLQLDLTGWPSLLPPPPLLAFRITPAGLVEWCNDGAAAVPDLLATVDASNPALLALRAMGGERPAVDIRGDSQLATDVDWLLKNLRWDVAADLERFFGPVVAHQLHKLGSMLSQGLRAGLEKAGGLAGRFGARGGFEGR